MTILGNWGVCCLSFRCTPWSRSDRKCLDALPSHSNGHHGHAPLKTMHEYLLSAGPPAQALEFSARRPLHGQSSLPTTGECPRLADGSMGPTSAGRMDRALGSHQGTSIPTLQGQQFVVGQRLEMPAAIGAPSTSRNYMANSSALVQARGISNAHRLPGQLLIQVCTEQMAQKGLGSTLLC